MAAKIECVCRHSKSLHRPWQSGGKVTPCRLVTCNCKKFKPRKKTDSNR